MVSVIWKSSEAEVEIEKVASHSVGTNGRAIMAHGSRETPEVGMLFIRRRDITRANILEFSLIKMSPLLYIFCSMKTFIAHINAALDHMLSRTHLPAAVMKKPPCLKN
jgi:hypothetical protein